MRRIALFLFVLAMAMVALAGGNSTASAAPNPTFHFTFHGSFAEAFWVTQTSTSIRDRYLSVQMDKRGSPSLFLDQFTESFDGNGNFTGATDIHGETESGVSFSINKSSLSSATASASVPSISCSYDAAFLIIGCSEVDQTVSASWTGEGPIARGTSTNNFRQGDFHEVDHFTGTERAASASGTVDGTSLGTSDLVFADLETELSGTVVICHNC